MEKNAVIEAATFSVGFKPMPECKSGLLPIVECAIKGIPTTVIIRTGESDLLSKGLITAGLGSGASLNGVISPSEFERFMQVVGELYSSPLIVVEEDR